jgi:hypothetical protein
MGLIKRCNEVVFAVNSLSIYEYSGILSCHIDLMDPANPAGELLENAEHNSNSEEVNTDEVYNATGNDIEIQNDDIRYFRGNLTNSSFTTTALLSRNLRK